VRITFERAN